MQKLTGILLILLVCLQAGAQQAPCTRRYLVAVNNYAPHFYRDGLNRPMGLTHELVEILQRRMGCIFIEKDVSRPVAIEQMKTGRLDLAFLVIKHPDLERSADFESLYTTRRELLVQKSSYSSGKTISDFLNDRKIMYGSFIGSRTALSQSEESELFKHHRILESTDLSSLYELFKKKRVQAIMMSPLMNEFHAKRLQMEDQVVRLVDDKSSVEIGIYYSKRRISRSERRLIREALEVLKQDGTLLKILKDYMPKESQPLIAVKGS